MGMMRRSRTVRDPDGQVVRRRPRPDDLWWDGRVWRRWNGHRWAEAAYSLRATALADPQPLHETPVLSDEARRRGLERAVEDRVLEAGAVVRHHTDHSAVLGALRPVSHVTHFLLTLLTGVWAIVWLVMALSRTEQRIRLEIDPHGHVWGSATVDARVTERQVRRSVAA